MNNDWRILEPYDWRYSAAITGLIRYFKYFDEKKDDWKIENECLIYNPASITQHDYLKFVEDNYPEDMAHLIIENMIHQDDLNEEQIKKVNEKMVANTVLKKTFKSIKFDGSNAHQIQQLLNDNREEIIRETFRNKLNLYRNYCNTNQLFQEAKECCRLLGYYIDMPKKGKSLAYNFNLNNFAGTDDEVFDFIPFAFQGVRDFFFVNDNVELENLYKTKSIFAYKLAEERKRAEENGKSLDSRQIFFKLLLETDKFIQSDIEIITKNIDASYYETLYLRKQSLNVLRGLKTGKDGKNPYQCFCFPIKITDKYYIDVFKEVTDAIVNLTLLDNLLDYMLKNNRESGYTYVIFQLIRVNILIKEDKELEQKTKQAYKCAKQMAWKMTGTVYKLPDNKLNAYRQKLTSALTFEDFDRFNIVLLNLSNYVDEPVDFAYDLFEDFEKNKELAYTFVNALRREPYDKQKEI